MKYKINLIVVLLFLSTVALGQSISFEVVSDVEVRSKTGDKLSFSGIGGLNQPQFYNLDIDNDGIMDIFVFDRNGGKVLSLIHDGNGNYTYKPQYDQIYPARFTTWVVLKDYNNDGLPDIWFDNEDAAEISLYRNITKAGDKYAKFELADLDLRAYNFNEPPLDTSDLYCQRTNIPAIEDVDGDGDIDFLTLQRGGFGITLFLNNTVENKKPLDPPGFEEADLCWGDFVEYEGSNEIDFHRDQFCFRKIYRKKHAGGSSLLLFDNDEDGDMDLVLGNAGLRNLNLLKNGKMENGMDIDTMVSADSLFPSNSVRAVVNTFPAAYYLDVDGDGIKDLIVSVNMFDKRSYIYRETGNIIYYKNKGKNNHPIFDYQDSLFISRDMVDHGGHTAPVLWDMDGDDDLDLIVATNGDYGITLDSADYLNLYENVGTKSKPVFQLAVEDYLGLRKDSIRHLAPCLGDLNRDGKPELIVGQLDGSLSPYTIIGTGKTATVNKVSDNTYGIEVYQSSTPCLYDVDGDTYVDLLVGSYDGNTVYYRNTSTTSIPKFEKQRDTFGGVVPGYYQWTLYYDPDKNDFYDTLMFYSAGFSSPVMADIDGNGDPEFVVGDWRGKISIYRNIRKAGLDSFTLLEETPFYNSFLNMCYDYNFGDKARPALGDLNNDGRLDMVVGTDRGGFMVAMGSGSCNLGISENHLISKPLNIYPNPTDGMVYFGDMQDASGVVFVTDLNGQQVWNGEIRTGQGIDLSGLQNGVYLIRLFTSSEQRTGKLIKLSK